MKPIKGTQGNHHEQDDRGTRSRDGETWPASGGAAVSDAQCKGYSGSDGKSLTSKSGSGGGPMSGRSENMAYKS